jgi:hypothetical protein
LRVDYFRRVTADEYKSRLRKGPGDFGEAVSVIRIFQQQGSVCPLNPLQLPDKLNEARDVPSHKPGPPPLDIQRVGIFLREIRSDRNGIVLARPNLTFAKMLIQFCMNDRFCPRVCVKVEEPIPVQDVEHGHTVEVPAGEEQGLQNRGA